jgi:hypothetical protein
MMFQRPLVFEAQDWAISAWADFRREIRMSARQAIEFWPTYWQTLCAETVWIASTSTGLSHQDAILSDGSAASAEIS